MTLKPDHSLAYSVAHAAPTADPATVQLVVKAYTHVRARDGGDVAVLAAIATAVSRGPEDEPDTRERSCRFCARPFEPHRVTHVYCSQRCRVRDHRAH